MEQDDPPPLTQAILDSHFPKERPRMPNSQGLFELGLTLGGTVSAGAYTGGVLDFLMQALDAWEIAKQGPDPLLPRHKVVISNIGGASGGAINGAMMLRAAGIAFPHGANPANPFYATWTQGVDLQKLLSPGSDTPQGGLRAVFNCDPIAQQADRSVAFPGAPLGEMGTPQQRGYFADPLRLTMMVTNLTGLPYRISMSGDTSMGHDMVAHADWVRFALHVPGGQADALVSRNDEFALSSQSTLNWNLVANTSLCTSAFPFAFRAQPMTRPLPVFGYRAVLVPGEIPNANPMLPSEFDQVVAQTPLWDPLRKPAPGSTQTGTVNVDGGVTNNDPLDMVRTALGGLAGRNPRSATEAHRAVILMAPFSDAAALGPIDPPGLLRLMPTFVNGLVSQARFKAADLALAQAETVLSRFLIAPVGPGKDGVQTEGAAAIASGGLSGFLGFVDQGFLTHDYLLGRWNAYRFLQSHFAYPEDNIVFTEAGLTPAQIDAWCLKDAQGQPLLDNGKRQLPMIPLLPGVAAARPGVWPCLPAVPAWLDGAVKVRLDLLVAQAKAELLPSGLLGGAGSLAISTAWALLGGTLRSAVVTFLTKSLRDAGLLPPPSAAPPSSNDPGGRGG